MPLAILFTLPLEPRSVNGDSDDTLFFYMEMRLID